MVYARSHSHDQRAREALLRILADNAEFPAVRAQAAEGIGYLMIFEDRRTKRYKTSVTALLAALEDSSPEIRFWSVFALATGQSRSALPALRRLAKSDTAMVEGWWRVKDEAADAVQFMETGDWPDRKRIP